MSGSPLDKILSNLRALEQEHNKTLATVDTAARPRIVTVEALYEQLSGLSGSVEEHMRLAIRCMEGGLYRPAIVMAWAACAASMLDAVQEDDGRARVLSARPKWAPLKSEEDIPNEYQLIEAMKEAGFFGNTRRKTLQGLLNSRNKAAHPSGASPTLNSALAFVEDVIGELSAGFLVGSSL